MNNSILNNDTLMNIKNQKIVLYLTKIVMQLNDSCNNIIPDEKFQRAIIMFTNRNEDFETLKKVIDWYAENERKQYVEHLKRKRNFGGMGKNKNNKIKSLQKKRIA